MNDHPGATLAVPREPRQRWRLIVARSLAASSTTQREVADAWEQALAASPLPVVVTDPERRRLRVAFGAPLPTGVPAEREVIDLFLGERVPMWRVREAVQGSAPEGWALIDLYDVWLAGQPLPAAVVAAEYRIELDGTATADRVGAAAERLRAARTLPRERVKGGGTVSYDLRPLLVDVVVTRPGPPVVVHARTRFHPELGTGRPEEVVAALEEESGAPLGIGSIVRAGLVIGDPLGPIV